ncbi:Predicted chitinase [Chryseobacterium carnipullorum]|uniref:Predicted chitinase n=1 Tax=Chryseobacterium carnipullorum TaxID=1124835 RepID=A0A376DSH9_CHRCU|nr:Predicted chitinase [Chryseobacterium carnipullorum]
MFLEKEPGLLNTKKIDELFDRKPLYKEKYIYYKDKVDDKGKKVLNTKGKPIKEKVIEIVDVDSASLIASNLYFAFDSAGWYWENLGKTVPTGENINLVADKDDVLKVSQCINGKVKNPYGLKERKEFTKNLKLFFKYDELCISKKK